MPAIMDLNIVPSGTNNRTYKRKVNNYNDSGYSPT